MRRAFCRRVVFEDYSFFAFPYSHDCGLIFSVGGGVRLTVHLIEGNTDRISHIHMLVRTAFK